MTTARVSRYAYFDTSVLVKRYLEEPGSIISRSLLRKYRFVSCALVQVEAFSTFVRLKAAGELSERNLAAILARVSADRRQWELVDLTSVLLSRAEEVVQRTRVRTLDALHVASALIFREHSSTALPFVTADEQQGDAAEQMGFSVVRVMPP